jgi:acetyltransferase-like isoleucine patch superfamily enzyme
MSILNETPNLEPLLRIMGLPPSLARYCPVSSGRPLRTMHLRDSMLARKSEVTWGDDCLLTVADGEQDKLGHVSLVLPGGRKHFAGIHLAILGGKGQVNVMLGGDDLTLFIGSETALRAGIHMATKATAFIGDHTTMGQARLGISYADLVVGDDCQFSDDVLIQCNDQHAICDAESGQPVHRDRRHVRIGRHVWLGRRPE